MARPAVPATVHLRMRFLKANGDPLAETYYRVRWGSEKAPPTPLSQTSPDGVVEEVLSGAFARGWVEFGEVPNPEAPDPKAFVTRLRVEVVLVKPPGPPSKHKKKDHEKDAVGPGKGNQQGGSPPGESPPSEPPASEDDPPESSPAVPAPGNLISSPTPKTSTLDFDPEGRGHATKAHQKKRYSTAIPDEEVERLHRTLQDQEDPASRYVAKRYAMQVRVFNLAWRLHNLGLLGVWSGYLTFPIDWGLYGKIVDALNRYAYKHGLKLVWESDLTSTNGEEDPLAVIWDHIEQTYDGF
ncbi:MAG: hypothetical protein U0441_13350 [Polyangiaceae bacterium]